MIIPTSSFWKKDFDLFRGNKGDFQVEKFNFPWKSSSNEVYNSLIVINICRIPSGQNNVKFSFKFTDNINYFNSKEKKFCKVSQNFDMTKSQQLATLLKFFTDKNRKILPVPEERCKNGTIGYKFIFQMKFANFYSIQYPENKSIISLGEEIEYLKSFLEQNNQWNHPITNYFTEDLCFHINDLYKRKEPVPFEGVLFSVNRLITRRMYDVFINLIEYQILLNQLELNNKFVIKELIDKEDIIIKNFQRIISERKYELNPRMNSINESTKIKMRDVISTYFVIYLLKYNTNQKELVSCVGMFNDNDYKGTKRLISIIANEDNFEIFKNNKIEIRDENLGNLIQYCQTEQDLRGILKFIQNLEMCKKVFEMSSKVLLEKEEKILKKAKPIMFVFTSKLNNENDLQQYANDCSEILKYKFKHIKIGGAVLQKGIEKLNSLTKMFAFINRNSSVINEMNISLDFTKDKKCYPIFQDNTLEGLQRLLKEFNHIYELKRQNLFSKIKTDFSLIMNILPMVCTHLMISDILSFVESFKSKFPIIYPYLSGVLETIIHNKVKQTLIFGKEKNENLLLLMLKDKKNDNNDTSMIPKFCKLFSFEKMTPSFMKLFVDVVQNCFSKLQRPLLINLMQQNKSIIELYNFFLFVNELFKEIPSNVTKILFENGKRCFCEFIDKTEENQFEQIEYCLKQILRFYKDEDKKHLADIIHKIITYLPEKQAFQLIYNIDTTKIVLSEDVKQRINKFLFDKVNNITPEQSFEFIMKNSKNKGLLKKFFSSNDSGIKEEDFFSLNDNFQFYVKLKENKILDFKNEFSFLKDETFFKNTRNNFNKIVDTLKKKDFKLKEVNSLHKLIEEKKFRTYLKYLDHRNSLKEEDIINLESVVKEFINYDIALSNVIVYMHYFYKNSKDEKNIAKIKEKFITKTIRYLKEEEKDNLIYITNLNENVESIVKLIGKKFFDIIYKQTISNDQNIRIQTAKNNYDKLKYLLDINQYMKVPPEILNDLIYFCKTDEIQSEFKFLEEYFPKERKNQQQKVMEKVIIAADKNNMLRFVESVILLCDEYSIKETDFLRKYKTMKEQLEDNNINFENIQAIQQSLCEGMFNIKEKDKYYNKILMILSNKKQFYNFIADKTRESVEDLHEFFDHVEEQSLSLADFPCLVDVVGFCQDLREYKNKNDTDFLQEFKKMASNEKIAFSFELVIQKFLSFKDLYTSKNNKAEFAQEKIKEILNYSTISISYNVKELKINISIEYNKYPKRTILFKELFELQEKAQLKRKAQMNNIVDPTSQSSQDIDTNLQEIILFTEITQQIIELLNLLQLLVQKGDPNLHKYLIKIEEKIVSISIDSNERNETLKDISMKNKQRLEQLIRSQENIYKKEGNAILTFLFGKNIYQLQHFLKSKGSEGLNQIEPLFKYLTKNKYKRQHAEDLCKNFNYISGEDPTRFMEECVGKFLRELLQKCNVASDNIFNEVLIKNEKNIKPGIYTSLLDPVQLFQENLMKVYLRYTGHFPIPQALLFCNENTTLEEVTAFLYRALYYPNKVLFGIVQTESLQIAVREGIVSILEQEEKLSNVPITKRMKSVFVLFYTDLRLDIQNEMYQKNISKKENILNKLEGEEVDIQKYINYISIVHSNASGIGKSYTIKKETEKKNKKYEYFPIGGDFIREDIIQRLQTYKFEPGKSLIHLDIHETKKEDLIKDFLFSFLILRSYFFNDLLFYLESGVEIVIEIPFGFIDHFKQLPLLNLIPNKNVIFIDRKKLPPYEVSQDLVSDDQIVCSVLKLFQNKEINKKVVQHKGLGENDPMGVEFPVYLIENLIEQEECNQILNNVLDIKGATFYQKKIFISILANQFKYFLRSIFLDPNYLLGNGIAKNKPELYKIREIIIDCFIKLTNHFTKGAYDYLLQKENVSFKSFGLDYDLLKAEEAAIQELSKKKQVSFKDINPSLLLFNQDGQSLSVVTTIKPQKATKEQLQEYTNFTDLINSGNDTDKLEIHDYENINENDVFLEELIKILDINTKTFYKKDLLEKNLTFPMDKLVNKIEFLKKHIIKSFVFTADNFAKLILILIRIRANIPVILMGETGCGKTYLIRTMSELYGSDMKILNIHAGTTENDIINFLEQNKCFKEQNLTNNSKNVRPVWVFLDEINTCNALGLISEIMIKHTAQGKALHDNITFIGACNPYRLVDKKKNTTLLLGISKKMQTNKLNLVYTVNPLPHSLLNYVMDFGNLDEKDETKYIKSMVKETINKKCDKYKVNEDIKKQFLEYSTSSIVECQKFLKDNNDVSAVSLREVRRFVIFFKWFIKHLKMKIKDPYYKQVKNCTYSQLLEDMKNNKYDNLFKYSIILSLYVCYYLRLPNYALREVMNKKLSKILEVENFEDFPMEESIDIAMRVHISKGIALNQAFLDNLYGLFVCVNTQVPIIICGKPGCSKSLSVQILINAMKGEHSDNYLFKNLPRLYVTSYQGAKTSTSEGVLSAFTKARNIVIQNKSDESNNSNKDTKDKIISLLFFDEMGLAEISENNPLKVIHSQLEYDDNKNKISFVGISNWALDSSKMNRCVFLAILEPNKENLVYTAECIGESFKEGLSKGQHNLKLLHNLAENYYIYKGHLKNKHPNYYDYHGLRDFYNMIKYVCESIISKKNANLNQIGTISLERNFGGLSFSIQSAKEIFNNILHGNGAIAKNYDVLDRITQNITDYKSRFLLIFTKSHSVQSIIESLIKSEKKEFVFYNGSQFIEDQKSQAYNIRMLTKMKKATEEGKILCLSNLDFLYPSYYDVFNQNYSVRDGKKYARVALGIGTNIQVYVHDEFRVVILMNTKQLKPDSLPETPFLNRFEKHILSYNDLFLEREVTAQINNFISEFNQLNKLKSEIKLEDIILDPKYLFINCNDEEIKGIFHQIKEQNPDEEIRGLETKVLDKLVKLFPQDLLAFFDLSESSSKTSTIKRIYNSYNKIAPMNGSLKKYLQKTKFTKSIIYTYTPILKLITNFSCESEFPKFGKQQITVNTIKQITIGSCSMEVEIEKLLLDFYNHKTQNLCLLKFAPDDCIHINSVKNLIDNLEKEKLISVNSPKKLIIVIHLTRILTTETYDAEEFKEIKLDETQLISQLVSDYDQITIDDLFSENEEINIVEYLSKDNGELLVPSSKDNKKNLLFDFDTVLEEVLEECLNTIKYNQKNKESNRENINIDEYKKQVIELIKNNPEIKKSIGNIISKTANESEKYFNSVFKKNNKAFTIYYTSFIEVFKNYLTRKFMELLIKLLVVLEREGVFNTLLTNENEENDKLKQYNKTAFDTFVQSLDLYDIIVQFDDDSNEVNFISGIKIIQSLGKFKTICENISKSIENYALRQNQLRRMENQENEDENTHILNKQISSELTNAFSEDYSSNFQEKIFNDYLKFFLFSNSLKETEFFEQLLKLLIKTKYGNQTEGSFEEKFLWLESNKEYIVNICLMYKEFLDEQGILPFFEEIENEINNKNEQNSSDLNKGLFEISECLLKVLLSWDNLFENIDKLKTILQIMKILDISLALNSQYLIECETLIKVYDFFPSENKKENTKQYIEEKEIEKRLELLKTREKDKQTVNKIIDILIAEFQKNKENNGDIQNIINFLWEDMSLVLASKKLIYAILYMNGPKFELDIQKENYFEKLSNQINYNLFPNWEENLKDKIDKKDFDKKQFIIEEHFLFIFEIICKDFFERLTELAGKGKEGQDQLKSKVQIIQSIEDQNNEDSQTNGLAYYYLELSLERIAYSVKENKINGQRIEFLYCVAYIKTYLSYLVRYTIESTEALGNIRSIIYKLKDSFGGINHDFFKKAMNYYIIKLFDNYVSIYSQLKYLQWETNQFSSIVEELKLINEEEDNINELDFPFYGETVVYLNIYHEYIEHNLKEDTYEDFKQLFGNNTIEFVNFLLNTIFVYLLEYSKNKLKDNNELDNQLPLLRGFTKYAFVSEKDFQSCLELFLNCEKGSQAKFFKDIQTISQKDYVKLLFCFKLVLIIANKKNGNYSKIYSSLYNLFNEKNSNNISDEEKLSYVIYLSLRFFGNYLNVLSNSQKYDIESESVNDLLYKLLESFDGLNTLTNVPIEIFLHLFSQKYQDGLEFKQALNVTLTDINKFEKEYMAKISEVFHITKTDNKSIIREIFNPIEYENTDLTFLKYFMFSNTISIDKHKTNIQLYNKETKFPLFSFLYQTKEIERIQYLSHLNDLNPFGKEILEYYIKNQLTQEKAKNRKISSFVNNDDSFETRNELFEKFQNSWNNIKLEKFDKNYPKKIVKETIEQESCILNCLPEKTLGEKGYCYTYMLEQFMKIQNDFLKQMEEYLKSKEHNNKFDYLLSHITKCIGIQDASPNEIVTFKLKENNFHFRKIFDLFKVCSERKCFDSNGNFKYRAYKNVIVDDLTLHEELIKLILPGKYKLANIRYIEFIIEDQNKIQENLNNKQKGKNPDKMRRNKHF